MSAGEVSAWLLEQFDHYDGEVGCYTRRMFELIDDDDDWHAAARWPNPPMSLELSDAR